VVARRSRVVATGTGAASSLSVEHDGTERWAVSCFLPTG